MRSPPSEWNTHVVVWRNKPDLDTMRFDDLYNNFKIVEQEVKGTVSSSSSSNSHNMAFMSSPSSTNEVNTAYGVSPSNTQVSTANTQVSTANLNDIDEMDLKWQLALLSMRTTRFFRKTGRKITINGSDTAGYDKSKVECFNCHKMGHFAWECKGPRNQDSRNRNEDSSRRTINVEETSSKAMVAIDGAGFDWSYMADDEVPTNMALMAFLDSEPGFEGYGPKTSKNVSEDTSNEVRESPDAPMVEKLVSDDKLEKKTVFPTVTKIEFVRPKQQEKPVRKRVKYAEMYRNMVPRAVLMKCGLRSLNIAMPITTTHPKTTVYIARPMSHFSKSAQSTGIPQKEDQGYVDSGCSRHMTRNMSYLSDFKEINGGYMCDKKNSVIFTDTGCFVLSPNFKLVDESQVLLKVPRKNNMYSVDMKNIIPKECLTCLVAKATLDESMQ
ncbi:ribonuclease H-like domain-containing protein [Tanacetum coccineum]